MTPHEIVEYIESMDNANRMDTLELLYSTYFYMGLTEEERQILKDYYQGELVRVENFR